MVFRTQLQPRDEERVERIVTSTKKFNDGEVAIAVELVVERRSKGDASGYHFVFGDSGSETLGYACFGPIPATQSSYDLYWIAVDAGLQRRGLGRRLIAEVEASIARLGGTRIYVDTSSREDYAPTRAFYRGMGYIVEAELESFYAPGDGKVVFCKVLGN
ncbi:MAG: GNAT family N-acetyltransferase [Planctomycetes bacterium]|nr:GNAT family N-acetyltransferase [Planctomycetota bacterium]MCB9890999.1 GNAT family N-acetyltransferase [Planctomycetota bacterium]MCB9919148.1 GNAT family N-acetyltransferase [Planctomycetota bacterium]